MGVSFATCPGSVDKPNEDFVATSPSVAVVLDGLSAPSPLGTGCIHGTSWFVAQLGTQLLRTAAIAHGEPLQELVTGAIGRVADSHAHTCDLEHPGTPSSLVILREQDQAIYYLLLFDSVLVLDGHPASWSSPIAASTRSPSRSTWRP